MERLQDAEVGGETGVLLTGLIQISSNIRDRRPLGCCNFCPWIAIMSLNFNIVSGERVAT